jgi:nicotinic acid mononucleotide adenylyltransferase
MIKKALKHEKIKNYKIIGIKDYEKDEEWLKRIKNLDFDIAITGNKETKKLLESIGKKVLDAEIIKGISATKIRELVRKGKDYKKLVPEAVYDYVKNKRI